MLPLQVDLVGGGPVALVVTFLVTAIFYAVTLHLAALWVLGDPPHQRAVAVSPVPAVISIVFARYGMAVVLPLAFLGTLVAVRQVYRLKIRSAALVTVFHFAIAVILGIALRNLLVA